MHTARFSKGFFLLSIKISERQEELSDKDSFYQPTPDTEKDCLPGILFHQELSKIKSPGPEEESFRILWNQPVPGILIFPRGRLVLSGV